MRSISRSWLVFLALLLAVHSQIALGADSIKEAAPPPTQEVSPLANKEGVSPAQPAVKKAKTRKRPKTGSSKKKSAASKPMVPAKPATEPVKSVEPLPTIPVTPFVPQNP